MKRPTHLHTLRVPALAAGAIAAHALLLITVFQCLAWLSADPLPRLQSPVMVAWLARAALIGWVQAAVTRRLREAARPRLQGAVWWAQAGLGAVWIALLAVGAGINFTVLCSLTLFVVGEIYCLAAYRQGRRGRRVAHGLLGVAALLAAARLGLLIDDHAAHGRQIVQLAGMTLLEVNALAAGGWLLARVLRRFTTARRVRA